MPAQERISELNPISHGSINAAAMVMELADPGVASYKMTVATLEQKLQDDGMVLNPMTTAGDLIVGGAAGAPTRLPKGTNSFLLTMVAGAVAWAAFTGMTNPMTTAGDLIVGGVAGAPARLAVGAGTVPFLTVTAAAPAWGDLTTAATGITSVGTIATGVWQGTILGGTYGGTGVNNGARTLTMGGSVTYSGAFASTFTLTNTTAVTFPTAGTLATTAGNVATATALQTARAINGVNFDGTAAITVTAAAGTLTGATLAANVLASSLTSHGTLTAFAADTGSIATSQPYTMSSTWNAAGVAFTTFQILITSTASAAGSLIADWQVGGASKFSVSKTGAITCAGSVMTWANATLKLPSISPNTVDFFDAGLATYRGTLQTTADGVFELVGSANTTPRLCFEGVTAAFPSLKRSAAVLQCRVADDSAYAGFDALSYSVGGVAGATFAASAIVTLTVTGGLVVAKT